MSLHFAVGSCSIPAHDKTNGGEDAWFGTTCGRAMGVADGVGGWSRYGIDSGRFSRALMSECERELTIAECWSTPKTALNAAFRTVSPREKGSATVCVATIAPDDRFRAVNIGDSGFAVLRRNATGEYETQMRSIERRHYFDCPMQIGTDCEDKVEDGDEYDIKVRANDVVLLMTDGVWDNLFMPAIEMVVNEWWSDRANVMNATSLAQTLASVAYETSMDEDVVTPYAFDSLAAGTSCSGGKVDDVTVVVGVVVGATT
jgi:protein phosphatase PTC7